MRKLTGFTAVLFFLFSFFFIKSAFASELSADNFPLTIDRLQDFEINVNFSCSGCDDSYLRGVFYPSGNSYFGYTQNNAGNWINSPGGDCTDYFKIAKEDLTPEGSWSGKLKFKSDIDSSYYSGPGEYLFKIGYYTPECSSPSVWSEESTIAITGPTPTPIPDPTSTPSPSPTSTPTPTNTPTPTLKPTPSSMPKSASSEAVLGKNIGSRSAASFDNMGLLGSNELFAGESKNKNNNWFQKIFILVGIVFIAACAILTVRMIKKGEDVSDE